MIAACTIVSPNYLPFARVLSRSYLAHHPDHRFFVLLVADTADAMPFRSEPFALVMLDEIGLADVRATAMMYDILELNTNVKPAFLEHLFAEHGAEQVVYLDPDIRVYSPLTPVFAALDAGASAVLTPHITEPIADARSPSEQDHLYNGTYNLGFIAVRRCAETARLLAWWSERCLTLGFSEGRTGLFVDQKWMNLAPGLFAQVAILRDRGCNMAYWNLQERRLTAAGARDGETPGASAAGERMQRTYAAAGGARRQTEAEAGVAIAEPAIASGDGVTVNEAYLVNESVPLCFFHFSGIDPEDAEQISRNTDRFTLRERPDLRALFASYREALALERGPATEDGAPAGRVAYGFDRLSDGTIVTRLARRIYSQHRKRWAGQDPFDANGGFARFAKRLGLLGGKEAAAKNTWREFNPRDRRVLMIHRSLRAALRVLGPNRYELLMRYLAHIAVLRHQSVFLDEPQR